MKETFEEITQTTDSGACGMKEAFEKMTEELNLVFVKIKQPSLLILVFLK